jgi:predicted DNA-binding transcriptional regulator YafY
VEQVREVLRAWLSGVGQRPAAKRAGVDRKTAARYIEAAQEVGVARAGGRQLSDEVVGDRGGARPGRTAR